MSTITLTVTAQQLRDILAPVAPMAASDAMLPVLNAVFVRTDGEWLSARATDRFRLGIKRIRKVVTDEDASAEWPEFEALIPLRSVRSLLTMFKPTRRSNPSLTLTVDGENLIAEGTGQFDLFDSSRFTYRLEMGTYPNLDKLVRDALATPAADRAGEFGVNPTLLASFNVGPTVRVLAGAVGKGIVITDDDGFLGVLMPRRAVDVEQEDWTDFLAEKPEPKNTGKGRVA